jgi:hypothetical protein
MGEKDCHDYCIVTPVEIGGRAREWETRKKPDQGLTLTSVV